MRASPARLDEDLVAFRLSPRPHPRPSASSQFGSIVCADGGHTF
jgi:hypothetical protein